MSTLSISRKIRTNFRFVKKIPEAETPGTRGVIPHFIYIQIMLYSVELKAA